MTQIVSESPESPIDQSLATEHLQSDLGGRGVRGGAITLVAQACKFVIQVGSAAMLARLVSPQDYGLIAMVTAFTGVLVVFQDLGLAAATIQRDQISHEEVSTLFWLNVALSIVLASIMMAMGPFLRWFYDEPRVVGITFGFAGTFIIAGLAAQPQAILNRQMRFGALAFIDIATSLIGIGAGIVMAWHGWAYWALVGMTAVSLSAKTALVWMLCDWRPGKMRRSSGVFAMVRFGANLTGFQFINYFSRNADNMVIGYSWGSEVLGLYSRAYQILMLPIMQISGPVTAVAVPILSRVQNDPARYRHYYVRGLSFVAAATMPIIALLAVFAREVVLLVLGQKWEGCVPLFQTLSIAAFLGPTAGTVGWLYVSSGRTDQFLRWSFVSSGVTVMAFAIGLPWGAIGVSTAYSAIIVLTFIPSFVVAIRHTSIRLRDVGVAIAPPLFACIAATGAGWLARIATVQHLSHFGVFVVGALVMSVTYFVGLFQFAGQWPIYLNAAKHLWPVAGPVADRNELVYVISGELFSSVFHSQIWTPLLRQSSHMRVHLVALVPIGYIIRARLRKQLANLRRTASGMNNFSLHLLPAPPSRLPWLWGQAFVLRLWLRRRFSSDTRMIVQGRNSVAFDYAARACRDFRNAKLVFDCRGAMPQEFLQLEGIQERLPDSWPRKIRRGYARLRRIERESLRRADHICCVSEAMALHLRDDSNVRPEKLTVIPCCPDLQNFAKWIPLRNQVRKELKLADHFVITYCGSMAWYQWPEQALRVFRIIKSFRPHAHFLGLTTEPAALLAVVRQMGISSESVTIRSAPSAEIPRLLVASDFAMLLRDRTLVNRVAAPIKFGEYLASGTPVIISDSLGDYTDAVRSGGFGVVLDPFVSDVEIRARLESGFASIARDPRAVQQAAVEFVRTHMNLDECLGRLRGSFHGMWQEVARNSA